MVDAMFVGGFFNYAVSSRFRGNLSTKRIQLTASMFTRLTFLIRTTFNVCIRLQKDPLKKDDCDEGSRCDVSPGEKDVKVNDNQAELLRDDYSVANIFFFIPLRG